MKAKRLQINIKFYSGLPRRQECIPVLWIEKKEKEDLKESAWVFRVSYDYSIYYKQPEEYFLPPVFAFSCKCRG